MPVKLLVSRLLLSTYYVILYTNPELVLVLLILCRCGSNVKLLHFSTVAGVWYYYHHYDNTIVVIALCNIIVIVMVSTLTNSQKC